MPDEAAARRPDFEPGVPVTLADGQPWHFRRPTVEMYPAIGEGGSVSVGYSFGPAYDAMMDDLEAAAPGVDQVAALMKLAVHLLRPNYDLTPADYRALLPFRGGDEANAAMWQSIAATALGTGGKKPSGGGCS